MLTATQCWEILQQIADPELPAVSVCELGIVREVRAAQNGVTVVVTPTYSGCPATDMIERSIRDALESAGAPDVVIETRLAPAWTSDWLSAEGREKLRAHGIAPPRSGVSDRARTLRFMPPAPSCPRCCATTTTRLSEFGSTACKALYRCDVCREPFEYFKPI